MSDRIKITERPANERAKDFLSVNNGYSRDQAIEEARRCLQCKKPACVEGCPVGINIPAFIKAIAGGNPVEAAVIIKEKNNLPAVCGRVCPQEDQCELKCILNKKDASVAIGNLERYAADMEKETGARVKGIGDRENKVKKLNGKRVAVIGSGPAGLTCAGDLAKKGFDVTVFESLHSPGGVLRYGIPSFRLPPEILNYEIKNLENIGVHFVLNTLIGRTKTVQELFDEGFKAIFIGTGAGLPNFLNVPGENLNNIYSVNEFLVRINLMRAYEFPMYDTPVYSGRKTVVVGAGNTAMDAARTALRMGSEEVTIIYRRSEEEMPARREEIEHAKEEGIKFRLLTNPVRFTGDEKGFVTGLECVKMQLGEADASGRRRPEVISGSNFMLSADTVIIAVGLRPNPLLVSLTGGLQTQRNGELAVDENLMTTIPGVFAGGDIVGGETVIQAMGMAKRAAQSIETYLK